MKKTLAILFILIISNISVFATTHTITNSGFNFTPATITITMGDDVEFVLGGSHNALEVSQSTWDANGNSPLPGFETAFGGGFVTAAELGLGTHWYVCSPHASLGMKGKIIVQNCTTPDMPAPIMGSTDVCENQSETYSVTPVMGASGYIWTLPSGWSGSSTTETINVNPSADGGEITVKAENACGESSAQSLSVTSSTIPPIPGIIDGLTEICAFTSNTYSIASVSGATSYTWSLPNGWTGASTSESITATANNIGGVITVVAENDCGTSLAQELEVTVNSIPTQPNSIAGNQVICGFTTNTYSVTPVIGAISYTWTLPNGWTGTSDTESITTTANDQSGDITVLANNDCGSSQEQTLAITVDNTPNTPGTISGNDNICQYTTNTYSITPVAGATSYSWSLPNGWTGNSDTESIDATSNDQGSDITVTAINNCGASAEQIITIIVNTVNIAVTQAGAELTADLSGGVYQWIDCEDNEPISGATDQSYTATQNGDYAVIITDNNCTDTSACYNVTSTESDNYFNEIKIQVTPNPSNGQFRILSSNSSLDDAQIKIFDSQGRMIHQSHYILNEINLQEEKGLYFLKVIQHNTIITKKLILQ